MDRARHVVFIGAVAALILGAVTIGGAYLYEEMGFSGILDLAWKAAVLLLLLDISRKLKRPH